MCEAFFRMACADVPCMDKLLDCTVREISACVYVCGHVTYETCKNLHLLQLVILVCLGALLLLFRPFL